MIVIGVRADQGLAWPDQLKSSSGIRVIRLSALQEAAAVDICVYVFARVRQGLSQASDRDQCCEPHEVCRHRSSL